MLMANVNGAYECRYEPVWAIGTGLVCDAKIAQEVHKFIRGWLAKMYDQSVAGPCVCVWERERKKKREKDMLAVFS
jgi:triosephosphate isomerase